MVPPYHAYSPSGSVYAKAVFVNYGREEDYRELGSLGVNVSGCIVIARKGDILTRGAVVETAEVHGAAAVLIYADVDSFRNGFERGHVMRGLGDPLSPGWSGVDGGQSLDLDDSEVLKRFPKIPSMPLSAETAESILYSLEGAWVPQEWRNNLRSEVWHVGPGPTMLNFSYQVGDVIHSYSGHTFVVFICLCHLLLFSGRITLFEHRVLSLTFGILFFVIWLLRLLVGRICL